MDDVFYNEKEYNPFTYKPIETVGYWDECNSWHDSCYIHSGLNPMPICDVEGPDAKKFLEKYLVNTFEKRHIGKGMHAIACNDQGKITCDGILVKTSENAYRAFCIMALPDLYESEKGNYDLTLTDITGEVVVYQFCGPRSLELIETTVESDLHHLGFMCYEQVIIDGMPAQILRVGMAGSLGYEIHCLTKDAGKIYEKVMRVGKQYGLVQLGRHSYRNTHTEGGFTQANIHFWDASYTHECDNEVGIRSDPKQPAFLSQMAPPIYYDGSLSDGDCSTLYRTPTESGWAKMVKFDHDFVGRAALEAEATNPKRVMTSLEWNADDVMDVWASILKDGKPYKRMDVPEDLTPYEACPYVPKTGTAMPATPFLLQDRVFVNGKEVGISSGRVYSPHYRKMISLCTIDKELAVEGTQVEILWGNPGTKQKYIRATVARFPYVNDNRNEKLDVSKIPSGVPADKKCKNKGGK